MPRTALITGASTGIGYELAKCFARDGHSLILVARGEDRLRRVASELQSLASTAPPPRVIAKDLTNASAPDEIHAEIQRDGVSIDVLVNNAGFGSLGPFAQSDVRSELHMIQVNCSAVAHLTRLFLPGMIERRAGGILNVASTASFQAGPFMATYYATKAFVLSFSEAIAEEVKEYNVTVSAVCPGPTTTEFQARAGVSHSRLFGGGMMRVMDPASVAAAAYEGFRRGKRIIVPGLMNKLGVQGTRLVPRRTAAKFAASLNRSKQA